ncbi:hypothetical protein E4U58_004026 [Claviceps cyperi]|nr:hypothetical protein E4U58_004026 [Claviceps cyperi]
MMSNDTDLLSAEKNTLTPRLPMLSRTDALETLAVTLNDRFFQHKRANRANAHGGLGGTVGEALCRVLFEFCLQPNLQVPCADEDGWRAKAENKAKFPPIYDSDNAATQHVDYANDDESHVDGKKLM